MNMSNLSIGDYDMTRVRVECGSEMHHRRCDADVVRGGGDEEGRAPLPGACVGLTGALDYSQGVEACSGYFLSYGGVF